MTNIVVDGCSCSGKTTLINKIKNKHYISFDSRYRKLYKIGLSKLDNNFYTKESKRKHLNKNYLDEINNEIVGKKNIIFDWVCGDMINDGLIFSNCKYVFIYTPIQNVIMNLISRINDSTRKPKKVLNSFAYYFTKGIKTDYIDTINFETILMFCNMNIKYGFESFDDLYNFLKNLFTQMNLDINNKDQYIQLKNKDIYTKIFKTNKMNMKKIIDTISLL